MTKPKTHAILKVRADTKRAVDRHSKSRGMTRVEFVDRAVKAFVKPVASTSAT